MVIAGKIRGNAPQLGSYLFEPGKNERITILHLDGREDATPEEFKDFLYSVELNSELTRSRNSAYHAYINPSPEDTIDRAMTKAEWFQSVEILTKHLEYEDQRHGAVLHDLGNGRIHAHIVYERYNHERGRMATYEHNYNAHDNARAEMEMVLNHQPTPQKNKNRDHHKHTLTQIWQRTRTGDQFIHEAEANGYKIAKGTDRPFRVIDAEGVSFDLVRKLDGIKTKEIKARFAQTGLMPEKEAIREQQAVKQKTGQPIVEPKEDHKWQVEQAQYKEIQPEHRASHLSEPKKEDQKIDEREEMRRQFLAQVKETRERNRSTIREITLYVLIALKVSFSFKGHSARAVKPDAKSVCMEQFSQNALDATLPEQMPDKTIRFENATQVYRKKYQLT